jgi:serine/threonine protein kinase
VVKVLDFGLAKAVESTAVASAGNLPTLTLRSTQIGVVMGTPAYMAPEQAAGKAVDKRADIWAFGTVLYETLTGASGAPHRPDPAPGAQRAAERAGRRSGDPLANPQLRPGRGAAARRSRAMGDE